MSRLVAVEVDGRSYEVNLVSEEPAWAPLARRRRERAAGPAGGGADAITSPMQGTVLSVRVEDGGPVSAGQVVCVIEAMKMENEIVAHRDGVVRGLTVAAGDTIVTGQLVCRIEAG